MRRLSETSNYSPTEFMRARRPELFSDSTVHKEPLLTPEVFEYHLDTLTNRKQETEFEYFCRRLAEKEICPNLIPQTGPTGGGDSKVDSETYPVADAISLRWYEGIGREASQERWAFAFSAKKEWRQKAESDVAKIVETERGYKLIYFITNQFVSDKKRSDVEDSLRKKYGIDVRILDRSWIMKSVFEKNSVALAIESLSLTQFEEKQYVRTGPRDAEVQRELEALEARISDSARYVGVEYQLAEDCLQSALLARQLGAPRVEVEGRFQRADRIAERVQHRQQIFRVIYAKAWTAYWWYEDFDELSRLYDQAEKLAINSEQADDLESLANLWTIMSSAIDAGELNPIDTQFSARTKILQASLDRLLADSRRPNNALQARTTLVLMKLASAVIRSPEIRESVFKEIDDVLEESEGLGSYPVEPLANIIREVGQYIVDSPSYEALFEHLILVMERRASEAAAGKALLERGIQKLQGHKNYDAIRLLGRAQQKLGMDEYRSECITALAICGSAYEAAGLLWAARANLLAAANLAFAEFTARGGLVPQALTCLRRLVWIEIQLGRIPCVLAWVELMSWVAHQLIIEDDLRESYEKERSQQDMVLSILLLKTEFLELKWLDFLPQVLERLGFDISWMTLLYALGYEDRLQSEKLIPKDQDQEATRSFFLKCLNQPAAKDIPDRPELMYGQKVQFSSVILGCEIVVESPNNLTSIYLSETVLGVLEAFMATSINERVFPHRSAFRLVVKPSRFDSELPEYRFDLPGTNVDLEIKHANELRYHTKEERQKFRSWLIELLSQIIGRVFIVSDASEYLELVGESGLHRALDFSEISIVVENILGQRPKIRLSDWESNGISERFPINRREAWNEGFQAESGKEAVSIFDRISKDEPTEEMLSLDQLKHRDIRVSTLINQSLWNKAGWKATAYPYFPDSDQPPFMALGFSDVEAGKAIFDEWRKQLGKIDYEDRLRVSIITGVDKRKPFSYKVVIGVDPKLKENDEPKLQYLISRVHRMDPLDHVNLGRFLTRLKQTGWYVLLPLPYKDEFSISVPLWESGIAKSKINIREAWQIGAHDPDVIALRADDDPVIPDGVDNPPVLDALKKWVNS